MTGAVELANGQDVEGAAPAIRQSALRRGLSLYAQAQLGQSIAQQTATAFQAWLAEACEDAGIELPPDGNVSVDFKTGAVVRGT